MTMEKEITFTLTMTEGQKEILVSILCVAEDEILKKLKEDLADNNTKLKEQSEVVSHVLSSIPELKSLWKIVNSKEPTDDSL